MKSLFKARLRQLKNSMALFGARKYILFLAVGGAIIGVMVFFFLKVFGFLYDRPEFPLYFKLFLSEKILLMTFLTMFMMLILSALIATLNIFFLSKDLYLLLSSPLSVRVVFFWKACEVTAASALMAVFFSLPVLFSFCFYFAPNPVQVATVLLVFLLYIITGVLIGILIGLTVPAFISVKRLQPVLSVISIIIVSAIVIFLRVLRPERFGNPDVVDNLFQYMGGLKVEGMVWFPFHWVARAMHLIAGKDYSGYFLFVLTFAGLILLLGVFLWYLQSRYYLTLFDKMNKGSGSTSRTAWNLPWVARLGLLPKDYVPLWKKEIKTFLRSPDQWSQLLIIGAIVIVFILNLKGIPIPHPSVKNLIAYLNMGMAAFVVAGLNSRFTFTTIPMEHPGVIHLVVSPFERVKLYRFKLFFYALPQLVIGLILFIAGDIALGLDSFARWSGFVFILPLLPVLTMMALFYSLKLEESVPLTPQHLVMSRSGISYMIWSLLYIVAAMVYFSRPTFLYYYNQFTHNPVPVLGIGIWMVGYVIVHFLVGLVLYRASIKLWCQKEII